MIYNELGRTGLKVSAVGLGTGGPSRLGMSYGRSPESSIRLIRFAIERGINFIDTAAAYGTEPVIGMAVKDCRQAVIVSTKAAMGPYFARLANVRNIARLAARLGEVAPFLASGRAMEERVNSSLRHLMTDYIDVFNLHAVRPAQYDSAVDRVLPTLIRLKETGKIRAIGITEAFARDGNHQMLVRAADESAFDCIMIGFNCVNQSGVTVAAQARQDRKGIIAMYVLRALRSRETLQALLNRLVLLGHIEKNDGDANRLLRLLAMNEVSSLPEAAIRFCRHELSPDVMLCGTGDTVHLKSAISACQAGPLPYPIAAELQRIFSKLSSACGAF